MHIKKNVRNSDKFIAYFMMFTFGMPMLALGAWMVVEQSSSVAAGIPVWAGQATLVGSVLFVVVGLVMGTRPDN